jgi:hypothetical protein
MTRCTFSGERGSKGNEPLKQRRCVKGKWIFCLHVDIRSGYFLSIFSPEKTFPPSIANSCNTVLSDSYASKQKYGTSLALSTTGS